MRKEALLIGIGEYDNLKDLDGVYDETRKMKDLLSEHWDGEPNFLCKAKMSNGGNITRAHLRRSFIDFLGDGSIDQGVLYFSGHGEIINGMGYLCTSDAAKDDPGISFFELQSLAINSPIDKLAVIIDCCYSGGIFRMLASNDGHTQLRKGLAILSASSVGQTSDMVNNRSLLTEAICHGLEGQAADLVGNVSIESIYRNADQYLTMANQRPQYASFLDHGMSLRKCEPTISRLIMKRIAALFRNTNEIPLSPAYEPSADPQDLEKQADFEILQELVKVNLVRPKGAKHMYFAAMDSKSCELTPFGIYYRDLVINRRI